MTMEMMERAKRRRATGISSNVFVHRNGSFLDSQLMTYSSAIFRNTGEQSDGGPLEDRQT